MRVVVTGYASLDHVVLLDDAPQADRTVRIRARPAWPRLGGSPAYIAGALVANGIEAAYPLSWVGDDAEGAAYRAGLAAQGIPVAGIATVVGGRTPFAVLAYSPDGQCFCLYDVGMPEPAALTPAQTELLTNAEWVCVTVGPPAVTDEVLARLSPRTRLVWVVKHDASAVLPAQAARLARRADVVCCNQAEAAFVAKAGGLGSEALVVVTRGAEGVVLYHNGIRTILPAEPVAARDPTGAGDTLIGGLIAALIAAPDDPVGAAQAGMRAAAELLRTRERSTTA